MNKTILTVPAGVRYLSDWAKMENGYRLEDYNFPHILDKQITGCGFTEYCIREQGVCEVICSPRRILLENKADQHSSDSNVIYFKNDIDSVVTFDKDIDRLAGSGRKKGSYAAFLEELRAKETEEERQREAQIRLQALKADLAHKISTLKDPSSCKILVTYDSFRHVKEVLKNLGILDRFYVVVDEFQSIFVDSKFKSDTEIELLHELSDLKRLCYVSATPMLEKYLDMLDEFKDLPYYELDWATAEPGRVSKPEINAKPCKSVLYEINNIVKEYKSGKFETYSYIDENGKIQEIVSNEAVIYVNSVKHICNIIKSSGLTLDETNVLCSKTPENEKKVKAAFRQSTGIKRISGNVIGTVPTKGMKHKMFTLCTRTVYLGADFYSTCARTFIASDANIDCLSVDISLDLPQILGRQRLEENPWKYRADLYYKTISGDNIEDAEIFKRRMEEKKADTQDLLDIYKDIDNNDREKKSTLARAYQRLAKVDHYRDNYVAVNKHAGSDLLPVLNKLVYVADIRTYEVQQVDFRDRVTVLNALSKEFSISENKIDEVVKEFHNLVSFQDKMRLICNTGFDDLSQSRLLRQLPMKFECYYNVLGPEKIKALYYRNDNIVEEYKRRLNNQDINLRDEILKLFSVGERYSLLAIKDELGKLYKKLGYERTPKAVDIKEVFEVKTCSIFTKENDATLKQNGFLILGIKEL